MYLFSRKLHRYLVIFIILLGLLMTVSGVLLKYPKISSDYLQFINLGFVRFLHNQISTYFGIALFIMIVTGAWLYFYPLWQQRKIKNKPDN